MKAKFFFRSACLTAATLGMTTTAHAQYAPAPGYPVANQPVYQQPIQQQPIYQQQPVYQQPVYQQVRQQPVYQQPIYGYPRVAMNDGTAPLPTPAEAVPTVAPTMQAPVIEPTPVYTQPAPAPAYAAPAPAYAPVETQAVQPAPQWQNYTGGGCATGDCGTNSSYPSATYGYGGDCGPQCGTGSRLIAPMAARQWFVGVYGLYMTRDNPGYARLAVSVDSPAAYPYYPPVTTNVLTTNSIDPDYQWGAEIRFGSTFGCACDPCNPCASTQPYAWEVGYWGITEDEDSVMTVDTLGNTARLYGMVNFAGLEYDRDGAGATYAYRPLNDYYDYQMPIEDPATAGPTDDIRVLSQRVRNTFEMQNLELNFLRFGTNRGCNPCCPSKFSFSGLAGVRYLKLDEGFQYAAMFTRVDTSNPAMPPMPGEPSAYSGYPVDDDNNLFYDIDTDNQLVGFQIGGNLNYQIGCKWNAFMDTNFGVYANNISVDQRIWSGGGGVVRFVNGGQNMMTSYDKEDVAFLGEARLGAGYQVTCNFRLTAAYRVMAVSGVALAVEQIPQDFSSPQSLGWIDSNDSIILHGLQLGGEYKF